MLRNGVQLQTAWRIAADVGSYQYRTTVLITTNPTPWLVNVGRQPTTQQWLIEGDMVSKSTSR